MKEIIVWGENGAEIFRINQMINIYGCWFEVVEIDVVEGYRRMVLEVSSIDEEFYKNAKN